MLPHVRPVLTGVFRVMLTFVGVAFLRLHMSPHRFNTILDPMAPKKSGQNVRRIARRHLCRRGSAAALRTKASHNQISVMARDGRMIFAGRSCNDPYKFAWSCHTILINYKWQRVKSIQIFLEWQEGELKLRGAYGDSLLLAASRFSQPSTEEIVMLSNADRQLKHRIDLDAIMNALVDQRRKIVAQAMVSMEDNKVPPTLAAELSEVQNGINAVALARRQEEMFSVMCKSWDYLLLSPTTICEEIEN